MDVRARARGARARTCCPSVRFDRTPRRGPFKASSRPPAPCTHGSDTAQTLSLSGWASTAAGVALSVTPAAPPPASFAATALLTLR